MSATVKAWRLTPGARIIVRRLGTPVAATVRGTSRVDGAVIVRWTADDRMTGSNRVALGHEFTVAR